MIFSEKISSIVSRGEISLKANERYRRHEVGEARKLVLKFNNI